MRSREPAEPWLESNLFVTLPFATEPGQVHGAVAQGIGNAIFEELAYDADGQLLTASLLDYLVPTATDIPPCIRSIRKPPRRLRSTGSKASAKPARWGHTPPSPMPLRMHYGPGALQ